MSPTYEQFKKELDEYFASVTPEQLRADLEKVGFKFEDSPAEAATTPVGPCNAYQEDGCVCDDMGDPKGQCAHCGYKWYEHSDEALPDAEKENMTVLNEIRQYQQSKK